MTRVALLDVNVLIALFDPGHVHHEPAHDWFADNRRSGWATCALTENGFLRVLSHPRAGIDADYRTLLESLRTFCRGSGHEFWAEQVSLTDDALFESSLPLTARQVTDVYLLGLAKRRKGRLATFDTTIPLKAVRGATLEHLAVIRPV